MKPTHKDVQAMFDVAVDLNATICTHCGEELGLSVVPEGHICPHCGFMRHRLTEQAHAYHEAWVAWNQVGGILYPHQSHPLPSERVRELGF